MKNQRLIQSGHSVSRFNNYKEYSGETMNRLQIIIRLKVFGFTINKIAGYLDMIEANQASCINVSGKIAEKVAWIDQKIIG